MSPEVPRSRGIRKKKEKPYEWGDDEPETHTEGPHNRQFTIGLTRGDYGIQSLATGRLTERQLDSAHKSLADYLKSAGEVSVNVRPELGPKRSVGKSMRRGARLHKRRGAKLHKATAPRVVYVKPGHVLFELSGVPDKLAYEALRLAMEKLPVKSHIIKRKRGIM